MYNDFTGDCRPYKGGIGKLKKKCVPDVSLAINSQIKMEQNFENYTPKIEIQWSSEIH